MFPSDLQYPSNTMARQGCRVVSAVRMKWTLLVSTSHARQGSLIATSRGCRPQAQWAAALVNEKKGPQRAVALPARVSKTGNVYVRLP
eukprot:1105895-Pleurochrysis_carterae.AAC.1